MDDLNRVFILGAGLSKAAGMPLATELLPLLNERLQLDEMREWLDRLQKRLAWLSSSEEGSKEFAQNIEQVFHYAYFDIEAERLRQQLFPVGRGDGPGTPWNQAEFIGAWLSYLEDALRDVILQCDEECNLAPITRWAKAVGERDAVLTFNYDTLVERALDDLNKPWNHGFEGEKSGGIPVFKLHGSIDWIVADRSESFSKLDLLFDKRNDNRSQRNTGHAEDDRRLWRCRSRKQLSEWLEDRDLQDVPSGAAPRTVGIAGLGAYKELHQIPGLGPIWSRGMNVLHQADLAIIVGFSMSDFDAMAQMQFADVARSRWDGPRRLHVVVIDPFATKTSKSRFRRVFRDVEFIEEHHEDVDWSIFDRSKIAP